MMTSALDLRLTRLPIYLDGSLPDWSNIFFFTKTNSLKSRKIYFDERTDGSVAFGQFQSRQK